MHAISTVPGRKDNSGPCWPLLADGVIVINPVSASKTMHHASAPHGYVGARRKRGHSVLFVVIAVVTPQLLLVGVLTAKLGIWPDIDYTPTAHADSSHIVGPLHVGDCVQKNAATPPAQPRATHGDTTTLPKEPLGRTEFTRVICTDNRVYGKVIDLVDNPDAGTEACDVRTDFFASQGDGLACLRQLNSSHHPGNPGMGGGVFRAGDCAATDDRGDIHEVSCASPDVFETIAARVKTVADCAEPAHRFAVLDGGTARVLCLGDGRTMANPGKCIANPQHGPVSFTAVSCDDPHLRAQVLARRSSIAACRTVAGQTHYVEDPAGLPYSRVVCLKMLPPSME